MNDKNAAENYLSIKGYYLCIKALLSLNCTKDHKPNFLCRSSLCIKFN